MVAVVPAGEKAGSTDQTTDDVGHDGAVQVSHDHHVELVRVGDQLHATIVDDHVVGLDLRVLLAHFSGNLQEQAIRQFPVITINPLHHYTA